MKRDLTTISATLSGHYWITRFQGSSVLPEQSVQQGNAGNIAWTGCNLPNIKFLSHPQMGCKWRAVGTATLGFWKRDSFWQKQSPKYSPYKYYIFVDLSRHRGGCGHKATKTVIAHWYKHLCLLWSLLDQQIKASTKWNLHMPALSVSVCMFTICGWYLTYPHGINMSPAL